MYLCNYISNITRNYTFYKFNKLELETLIEKEKLKVGEIYKSEFYGNTLDPIWLLF